uniref:Interferon gamma inducible protein 16-like protein transcript variant 3 n=1 Tax=Bubalus bubalis TaxID=89462 RepID=A0A286S9Z4_BUBBU|nr:interferon gamma inducible protein 16-like protein transcript variant 3 [Bubalus bubalis]
MGNDYKKIVLLKGFQHINDKCFNMIKSLLAHDLKLTRKMQDEYDRVKIADLMELKFRGPDCVDKLIELVKEIDEIKDLAKVLRKEKLKVLKKSKAKGATPAQNQDTSSLGQSTSTANEALGSKSVKDTPVKKKKTTKTNESKRKMISYNQSQLPGTSASSLSPTVSSGQSTPIVLPRVFSNFSIKKEENAHLSIGKIEDITTRTADPRMKLSLEQSQVLGIPTCSTIPIENCLQTPQKLPPTTSSSSSTKVTKVKQRTTTQS